MATRVTDGARRERHEKRETTRKARENGSSRSSDFLKRDCSQSRCSYPSKNNYSILIVFDNVLNSRHQCVRHWYSKEKFGA